MKGNEAAHAVTMPLPGEMIFENRIANATGFAGSRKMAYYQ